MLGSDRFSFETPNVIDPGDLPPARPVRSSHVLKKPVSPTGSTTSTQYSSEDEEHDYHAARTSTQRLLSDIRDLELNQEDAPYDPYRDDDDDDESSPLHSLPTVEEARTYAATLLQKNGRRSPVSPLSLERTMPIQLDHQKKHLVRRQCLRYCAPATVLLLGLIFMTAITGGILSKRNHDSIPDDAPVDRHENVSTRKKQVLEYLILQQISDETSFLSASSPQSRAARWMADEDMLQYEVPGPDAVLSDAVSYRFVQRYALATLFFATTGHAWTHTRNFLTAEDECAWYQSEQVVGFIGEATAVGVTCNANLQVRDIFLPSHHLVGVLPPELAQLRHLELLSLNDNEIVGPIPAALSSMDSLIYLDLTYNNLTGNLPDWIGDFEGLEVLGLSNNKLQGSVPPTWGTLGRLKTLALDDNLLTGSMDFCEHLTSLQYLYLDRNQFSDTVDESFLKALDQLRELDVSSNMLTSEAFPLHLFDHPTLHVIDLAENDLKGQLPTQFQENFALEFLSLRGNGFDGPLPASIEHLRKLTHLDIHGNHLTGVMPNSVGNLVELTYLFLGENDWEAANSLPPFLIQLGILRELSLTDSQLSGQIPDWLGTLDTLVLLDLSNNFLSGGISNAVWNLPNMTYLFLDHNNLSGELPQRVGGAPLNVVTLHKNGLLTGDANPLCSPESTPDLLSFDCRADLTCAEGCCPSCCQLDDDECYDQDLSLYMTVQEGLWEYNYERSAFHLDPDILDEAGLFHYETPPEPLAPP